MAWDSPTEHSPSFRSLQHGDQSPMTQEPPRVHTALASSPAWNSRHVPVKLQLQLRLSPVAPLRGPDPCASFPNPQHASSQQLCVQPKLLQPYPTRHQLPPAPGGFCVGGGVPRATRAPGAAGVLGSDLPGRIWARTRLGEERTMPRMLFGSKEGGIGPQSLLPQAARESPRVGTGCAMGLGVLEPEGAELWGAVGPEWDPELMRTRGLLSVLWVPEWTELRGFRGSGCA